MNTGSRWLIAGGILSLTAAFLHLACIAFGASWFRFFGAPEPLIVGYENGAMDLVWMTIAITGVLAIWGAYAFSGAGAIRRLPLLKTGLVTITGIYLLRGAFLIPAVINAPYPRHDFDIWSSAIVLAFGLIYAIGTWHVWPKLRSTPEQA